MLLLVLLPVLALVALTALSWYHAARALHPARRPACQTPIDLALDAERVEFPSRDGIRLRGWWIPSRNPRGTLVLSHGYAGDCSPDLEYARWLSDSGYNLLYFDHRAHGESDGNLCTLGWHETRDLLGAIDYLKGKGIERVGVIGFSMGGSVVLQAAALTDAIRCVVADCTFASLWTLLVGLAPLARVPQFIAPLGATLMLAIMSIQARSNLFAHSPAASIPRIAPRPVLLIGAGADAVIPRSEITRLYESAMDPKELWFVEGASHREVDRMDRAEYERRISAFLNAHMGAPAMAESVEPVAEPAAGAAQAVVAD